MKKKFPLNPKFPERICWGCVKYCPENDLQCGNGSIRIQHPQEIDGAQWYSSGDWQGLLSPEQLAQIDTEKNRKRPLQRKPHIRLHSGREKKSGEEK